MKHQEFINSVLYPVNEIFATIQGEGAFTGTPAVFIRLQGCDVGCPWCDTKHTWIFDQDARIDVVELLEKNEKASPEYAMLGAAETAGSAVYARKDRPIRHVVLTGGEPLMHDVGPLIDALLAFGFDVQIETSGTYAPPDRPDYWLTLSPKMEMPGGKDVLSSAWKRANEIKMPVGKDGDILRLQGELSANFPDALKPRVFLQPLSQSKKATELCVNAALRFGWSLSVQTHKFIGLR